LNLIVLIAFRQFLPIFAFPNRKVVRALMSVTDRETDESIMPKPIIFRAAEAAKNKN